VIFFYEILFVAVGVFAIFIGEAFSRTISVALLAVCFAASKLGELSFGARLAPAANESVPDEERRWAQDARDGLRHLSLLFGLASLAALAWRLIAG
jgi:hypothetical protein